MTDRNTCPPPPLVETLEPRSLRSAVLSGDTLTVSGTDGDDTIRLTSGIPYFVRVVVNRTTRGFFGVRNIVVDAGDGNDRVTLDLKPADAFAATLRGGAGNDTLLGGSAGDSLDGGPGDDLLRGGGGGDRLTGGPGNDELEGGPGRDRLDGGDGDDVLLAADSTTDTLSGGSGDDVLFVDPSTDRFDPGEGLNAVLDRSERPVPASATALPTVQPELSGPSQVGKRTLLLRDNSAPEPYTPDPRDKRRISVDVWYPAAATPSARPAKFSNSLITLARFATARDETLPLARALIALTSLRPHALADAPIAASGSPFPVILLSHGLGGGPQDYTSIASDLASRGYIVYAVNHTYGSYVNIDLPGRPVGRFNDGGESVPIDQNDELFGPLNAQWARDLSFVLSSAVTADRTRRSGFFGRIDTTKVIAAGHSFGGSAAVLASINDPRILGAVDIDGTLQGDSSVLPITKPVLFLQAGTSPIADPPADPGGDVLAQLGVTLDRWAVGRDYVVRSNNAIRNLRTSGGIWLSIDQASHLAFSDYALVGILDPGGIDPSRARTITTACIAGFATERFTGIEQDLLRSGTAQFPELSVVSA